jgi:hypothetical protein
MHDICLLSRYMQCVVNQVDIGDSKRFDIYDGAHLIGIVVILVSVVKSFMQICKTSW